MSLLNHSDTRVNNPLIIFTPARIPPDIPSIGAIIGDKATPKALAIIAPNEASPTAPKPKLIPLSTMAPAVPSLDLGRRSPIILAPMSQGVPNLPIVEPALLKAEPTLLNVLPPCVAEYPTMLAPGKAMGLVYVP